MIRILNEDSSGKNYIGGYLYSLPDEYWFDEDEDFRVSRYEEQDKYISEFGDTYIIYRPDQYDKFSLMDSERLLYDLSDGMAIKDGIDVIAYSDHIEVVAYYGSYTETAYLYPISAKKKSELIDLIDNADFDESEVIDGEISQYAYDGSSVQDVLSSWRK